MKYRNVLATVFVVTVLALSSAWTSTANAQATQAKNHYEIQQSGNLYCEETGWIHWSGTISIKIHSVTDGNGGTHYTSIADFSKVDGTDADGNAYQGSGRQTTRFNNPTGDAYEQTGSYSYMLVGTNGKGIVCSGTYRVIVNANGETTVSIDEPTVCECK